jgi:arsenical pump membrane protein
VAVLTDTTTLTWGISALATAGVIVRPFRVTEAIWAVAGALALVAFGLLPWTDALAGVRKGLDVYLFLTGMMLLAELARQEGLFDWLAALAVDHARGSPYRLFGLIYAVGTLVTVFLSNDATAVVLTPAVFAATRAAGASPLPYLYACAFIANAASFVLPISNPANLVVFDGRMPHLAAWLAQFSLPSAAAIAMTYLMLRMGQRDALAREHIAHVVRKPRLGPGGRLAACGIVAAATVLLSCSALDAQLGMPTFLCGAVTTAIVLAVSRRSSWRLLQNISWGVLPLVAGLFVLVEAVARTGLIVILGSMLGDAVASSVTTATWGAGILVSLACNLMNNLPVGLMAGSVVAAGHFSPQIAGAVLIGVDLGPNLSVTGSLATILWLVVLRREGIEVAAWPFLRIGLIVMPVTMLAALLAASLLGI